MVSRGAQGGHRLKHPRGGWRASGLLAQALDPLTTLLGAVYYFCCSVTVAHHSNLFIEQSICALHLHASSCHDIFTKQSLFGDAVEGSLFSGGVRAQVLAAAADINGSGRGGCDATTAAIPETSSTG